MKIIQLCAIDQTIKVLLSYFIKQLMDQGFEVLCVCSEGPYTEELKGEGLNIINIPIDRKVNILSNARSIYRLYRLFRTERPDILHVHTPIAAVLGRIAARFAGVPIIIYTAHGFYFHDNMSPVKYKLLLSLEKFLAKYFTDFLFTQSEEDRSTAVRYSFIDESKIVCIGNGVEVYGRFNPQNVDMAKFKYLNGYFGLTDKDIIVTFIGRLVREKGIVELLEAFSSIRSNDIKMLVVGDMDQGCRDQRTKDIILSNYKDNKNIIFTGFRDDINIILYRTDVFCLPSYREGMPRTIIEAMSMECAVIASDIRGCREEVLEGNTGFLVKPKSSNDIRSKLEILISNQELLSRMKAEGRKRAEEQYNEILVVDKQIKIINELYKSYQEKMISFSSS